MHLNNYHQQVTISLNQSLDKLQAAMAESGVDYALVLTSYLVDRNRPSTAERAVQRSLQRVRLGARMGADKKAASRRTCVHRLLAGTRVGRELEMRRDAVQWLYLHPAERGLRVAAMGRTVGRVLETAW